MRSETNLEVRSNCAIDLLRLICAVGVVTIHSISSTASAFSALASSALHAAPLIFFLISGYFWRDARGETSRERCKRRFLKTLRMTVFWVTAYMLFTTALAYPFHGRLEGVDSAGEWVRSFFSAKNLLSMLLIQRAEGVGTQLWYIMALAWAQLLLWGMYARKWTKARLPLAVLLLCAQFVLRWVNNRFALGLLPEHMRNAWLTGLPWMMIGDWLRGREESIRRIPTALLAAVGILGLFTLPLETWWGGSVEYTLGLHFASPALVMLAIQLGTNVDRPWARPARAFSLTLYLWHMLFVMPMAMAVTLLGLDARLRWLIAPVAVALCYLVYRIQGLWKARRAGRAQ